MVSRYEIKHALFNITYQPSNHCKLSLVKVLAVHYISQVKNYFFRMKHPHYPKIYNLLFFILKSAL